MDLGRRNNNTYKRLAGSSGGVRTKQEAGGKPVSILRPPKYSSAGRVRNAKQTGPLQNDGIQARAESGRSKGKQTGPIDVDEAMDAYHAGKLSMGVTEKAEPDNNSSKETNRFDRIGRTRNTSPLGNTNKASPRGKTKTSPVKSIEKVSPQDRRGKLKLVSQVPMIPGPVMPVETSETDKKDLPLPSLDIDSDSDDEDESPVRMGDDEDNLSVSTEVRKLSAGLAAAQEFTERLEREKQKYEQQYTNLNEKVKEMIHEQVSLTNIFETNLAIKDVELKIKDMELKQHSARRQELQQKVCQLEASLSKSKSGNASAWNICDEEFTPETKSSQPTESRIEELERTLQEKDALVKKLEQQSNASEELQQVLSYVDEVLSKSNHQSIEGLHKDYVKATESRKLNEAKLRELQRRLQEKEALVKTLEQEKEQGSGELQEVLSYVDSILSKSNHVSIESLREDYVKATESNQQSQSKVQEIRRQLDERDELIEELELQTEAALSQTKALETSLEKKTVKLKKKQAEVDKYVADNKELQEKAELLEAALAKPRQKKAKKLYEEFTSTSESQKLTEAKVKELERKLRAKDDLIGRMERQRSIAVSEELQQVLSYVDSVLKKSNHKSIESLHADYMKAVESSKLNESGIHELQRRLKEKEASVNELKQQKDAGAGELEEVLAYIDSILSHSKHGSLHTLLEDYLKATEFCKLSESKIQELELNLQKLESELQEKEDSSNTSELQSGESDNSSAAAAIGFVISPSPRTTSSIKEMRRNLRHQEKKLRRKMKRIDQLGQNGLYSQSRVGRYDSADDLESVVQQLKATTSNLQAQLHEAKMRIKMTTASKQRAEICAQEAQIELERTLLRLRQSEDSREENLTRIAELEEQLCDANSKLTEAEEVYSEYLATVADLDSERETLNSQLLQMNQRLQQLEEEESKLKSQLEEANGSITRMAAEKHRAEAWAAELQEALEAAVLELQDAEISRDEGKSRTAKLEAQLHDLNLELVQNEKLNSKYQADSIGRDVRVTNPNIKLQEMDAMCDNRQASQAAEISSLRSELSSVQSKLRESQEHRDRIQAKVSELSAELTVARSRLAEKEETYSKSRANIESMETELEQVILELQEANALLEEKGSIESALVSGLRSDLANTEARLQVASKKIHEFEREIQLLENDGQAANSSNDAIEELLKEREKENNGLQTEIDTLQRLLTQTRGHVEDLEDERNYSQAKLSELSKILEVRGETEAERQLYTKSIQLAEANIELNDVQQKLRTSEAKTETLEQEVQLLRGLVRDGDKSLEVDSSSEAKFVKLKEEHEKSLARTAEMNAQLAESRLRIDELSQMLRRQVDPDRSSSHSGGHLSNRFIDEEIAKESSHHGNRSRSSESTDTSKLESIDESESTVNMTTLQVQRMVQRIALLEEENAAYAASLSEVKSQLDARGEDSTER